MLLKFATSKRNKHLIKKVSFVSSTPPKNNFYNFFLLFVCLEEGSEKKVSGSEKFFEVNLLAQYMRHTHHLQPPSPLPPPESLRSTRFTMTIPPTTTTSSSTERISSSYHTIPEENLPPMPQISAAVSPPHHIPPAEKGGTVNFPIVRKSSRLLFPYARYQWSRESRKVEAH